MIGIDIPGRGRYELRNLVLDLNGTLATDGTLIPRVEERLAVLRASLNTVLLTADIHGRGAETAKQLDISLRKLVPGGEAEQKLAFIRQLGAENTVCVGNGANDALMLKEAAIGICVLGDEGASAAAMAGALVVVRDIKTALDLLLIPKRLIATLRK